MAENLMLSLEQARRLAVRGQHLAGPPSRPGRRRKELVVEAIFAEAGSAPDPLLPAALQSLASFAGADGVVSFRGGGHRRILTVG
jgi:uncharacterized protein YcaQ